MQPKSAAITIGMKTHHEKGFTLIELMVAVALLAITLAIGVPSFRDTIQANRMATQANEFVAALNFARSEAIKRATRATLCKSSDGSSCVTTGNWDQGWIVFIDSNNNAAADDGTGSILKVYSNLGSSTLSGNTNVANYVSYVSSGFTQLTTGAIQAGTFTLCPDTSGATGRSIVISATGRPTVSKVTCPSST
jgi:type IV fimbrial biogenesis protein FimT